MDLAGALGLGRRELVAFVGAGGKKTAMATLTKAGAPDRAVGYTTTTHMPPPEFPLVVGAPDRIEREEQSPVAFGAEYVENPDRVRAKLRGYEPATVSELFAAETFDWLLVKADGARQREFKAPADHEPAIPDRTTVVVVVASVRAVGEPLAQPVVHRPERVRALAGVDAGARITPDAMGAVIASPEGGLKGVPEASTVVVLVNKADSERQRASARSVLRAVFERSDRFSGGLVTSFREGVCLPVEPTV